MQQQHRLAARGNDVCRIGLSSCSFCIWDNQSLPVFGRPLLLCSHIYRAKSLFFLLGRLMCFDLSSGSAHLPFSVAKMEKAIQVLHPPIRFSVMLQEEILSY